jgi:hypothetical protein
MNIDRSVKVNNMIYRAQVISGGLRLDGYYVALLRYTYDAKTNRPLESHYWTLGKSWTKFPIGGEFQATPVFFLDWPKMARELVRHVPEPEAAKILAEVVDAAEEERARKS